MQREMPLTLPSYNRLSEKLTELGFSAFGMIAVQDLEMRDAAKHLKSWLEATYHGEMTWMANHYEKRVDPTSLMPDTQSILCVLMNYYPGEIPANAPAKIARYAHGDDYHKIIKKKLKALLAWLKSFDSRIEGRPLVDSAPILEKQLAVQAGLGWQGKHSNLITRTHGSWVFLGELLLNITFPDTPKPEPLGNFCGSCRRCIDACPTNAIVAEQVVDATKCIAYWTIEYKGETFPKTIQENLNGWLFGCDICQEVCPWNIKFAKMTEESAFLSRPWNTTPDLAAISTMDEDMFRVQFQNSSVKRVKQHGLRRNARLLMENDTI